MIEYRRHEDRPQLEERMEMAVCPFDGIGRGYPGSMGSFPGFDAQFPP